MVEQQHAPRYGPAMMSFYYPSVYAHRQFFEQQRARAKARKLMSSEELDLADMTCSTGSPAAPAVSKDSDGA